ncbi:MAG: hypothetical protein ICV79_24465, partial [Flavisolibacter sp.]|nr:hypothetical protein [Flavisolibacter sp.]
CRQPPFSGERKKNYYVRLRHNAQGHLHLIWQIQPSHKKEDVQRDFLMYTAQKIRYDLTVHHPKVLEHFTVKAKDRAYQFWERNPLSIDLYNHKTFMQKLLYIHRNPVQER